MRINIKLFICVIVFFSSTFFAMQVQQRNEKDFIQDSPTAQNFIVKQLDKVDAQGNNMVFMAEFPKESAQLRNVRSIIVNLDKQNTLTLRDDGKEGDEKEGDKVFSVLIKDDPKKIAEAMKQSNTILERNKGIQTTFQGRQMIQQKVAPVKFEEFLNGGRLALGPVAVSAITPVDFDKLKTNSLVITDLSVVQNPANTFNPCNNSGTAMGAWSFKKLMTDMANTPITGVSVDDFVKDWVDTFLFGQQSNAISGDISTPPIRDNLNNLTGSKRIVIAAWLRNSLGLTSAPTQAQINAWKTNPLLKIESFPVRLLAIVNRLDLRGNIGYGGGVADAGEGRLVFCFVDSNNNCRPADNSNFLKKMTVIFEYGIPITDCSTLNTYAQNWWNLKNETLGSALYITKLKALTDVFTAANTSPNKPNKNSINHLRTNEFIQSPWNIRDFEINATTKKLNIISPNKEPQNEANAAAGGGNVLAKVSALATFINTLTPANSESGNYTIPNTVGGIDAQMPLPSYHWNSTSAFTLNPDVRHNVSLNTCSGCHTGETKTLFTHINPAPFGTQASLSGFMTGIGTDIESNTAFDLFLDTDPMGAFHIKDVANGATTAKPSIQAGNHAFNDILRRAQSLETLVNSSCNIRGPFFSLRSILSFKPVNMEH